MHISKDALAHRLTSPGSTPSVEDQQVLQLDPEQLSDSRYQKKRNSPESIRQCAESIRASGLAQYPVVRVVGDRYELIAGHRRRDAFKLLHAEASTDQERTKWARIPCILKLGVSELEAAALNAIENLERNDGTVLEQALSLLEVKKAGAFETNKQVAETTGLNAQKVNRLLRLAEAPDVIQGAVVPGVLVEAENDRKERYKLELTVALAVIPYFRHFEREADAETALERTQRFLQRAAKGRWTRDRVDAEVRKVTGGRTDDAAPDDGGGAPEATESTPAPAPRSRRQLWRDRGQQWVLYPKNILLVAPDELPALRARLLAFVEQIDERLGTPREPTPTASAPANHG